MSDFIVPMPKRVYSRDNDSINFSRPGSVRSFNTIETTSGRARRATADRWTLMARYLYKKCAENNWLDDADSEGADLGVAVRKNDGRFVTMPTLSPDGDLLTVLTKLDCRAAFTMSCEIISSVIGQTPEGETEITTRGNRMRISIVATLQDLALPNINSSGHSGICLVRSEDYALVWSDSAETICDFARDIEEQLLSSLWGRSINPFRSATAPSRGFHTGQTTPDTYEKKAPIVTEQELRAQIDPDDEEAMRLPLRPMILTHSVIVGIAVILIMVTMTIGTARLFGETLLDHKYARWALVAGYPIFAWFGLFYFICFVNAPFQVFAPLGDISGNSRYHSAKAPRPERHPNYELPHITIQMPVYKEGLRGVIMPTVVSLLEAIRNYENLGGTASIFVNEDGMQTIKPELAEARRAYYEANNIAWCSRPGHNKDGFIRRGKFKKASNMNYCLYFATRVEDELAILLAAEATKANISQQDISITREQELYDIAFNKVLTSDGGRTWAAGDVRMGEIILIVDCDTRVPPDCLLFGALEMHESPEVAILQHASGVMQVVHNFFENAITYFTEGIIYPAIQFAIGSGDVAPFVGHNAFLRWKAIQSIAYQEDGVEKYWSECHVSEDFDIALRLQLQGFDIRLASYHHGGFKEGVSLTVFDELARWEKYAYGCNELMFRPLWQWYKGPFSALFLRFIFSPIRMSSKITVLSYIGTYYAISAALPLTLASYLLIGWYADSLDRFYNSSFNVWVGLLIVFMGMSPIAVAVMRTRFGQAKFLKALIDSYKWTPVFMLFFGGLSFHCSRALLCHMFGVNIEWSSTAKELEVTGFFIGIDRIIKDFKWMIIFLIPITGGMIYLGLFAPSGWQIANVSIILPLANQVACHWLVPLALGLF